MRRSSAGVCATTYFLKGRAFPGAHFCVRNARAQAIVGAVFNMPQGAYRAVQLVAAQIVAAKKMVPENRDHSKVLTRDAGEQENRSNYKPRIFKP
jgi:hypothetical protein